MKVLLEYLKDSTLGNAADADLQNLHSGVEKLKHRKDIEVKYMSMREYIMRETKEARRQGLEQGLEQGQIVKLISMIHKKIQKGKSFERVADELEEEDSVLILKLYELIVRYPEKTEEELYEMYAEG